MVTFSSEDRILIIVPHPDDETLGCAGIIQRAIKMKIPVKLVFLTYGDANEWSFIKSNKIRLPTIIPSSVKKIGVKRYKEALDACNVLGLKKDNIIFLGYPDFSILKMWYKHWHLEKPVKGILTRENKVPYDTAFRPGAKYKAEEILKDLRTIIASFKPTIVFTSHRLDYNSDHQALYLFVRVAMWDMKSKFKTKFFPFLTHFKTWPQPRGLNPSKRMQPPEYLQKELQWISFDLKENEINTKKRALQMHKTQMAATSTYLLAFICQNELFGDYKIRLTSEYLENEFHQVGENHYVTIIEENKVVDENFLSIGDHSIQIEDKNLIESILLSRKFGRSAIITFYIFPYSFDQKFEELSKYRIKIKRRDHEIYNLTKKLENDLIKVRRDKQKRSITLEFPLTLLDKPDYLLINVKSEVSNMLVDWVPWRIISMK